MSERVLASIERIQEVRPIPGADKICAYRVNGWWAVDKINAFKPGDLCIYLSIDSWSPHELTPFLSKGKEPREYNGVRGERVRTIRLRGQLSQGIILDPQILVDQYDFRPDHIVEGICVEATLGIQKWEAPVPAQLQGQVKGNYPPEIPKTDQTRIQSLVEYTDHYYEQTWTIQEKLDGTSATYYLNSDDEFMVTSRNINLKETEGNTYWTMARKYDIERRMRELNMQGLALRMEIIGPGIQKNLYKLDEHTPYLYDVYDAVNSTYLDTHRVQVIAQDLELNHVPIISLGFEPVREFGADNQGEFLERVLAMAEGRSQLNGKTEREGLVWKSLSDPNLSWKAISNRFLLKNE